MLARTALRRVVVATLLTLAVAAALVAAGPALASGVVPPEGSDGPAGLTVVETLGYFVVAPLAIFALITLAVLGPSIGRGARHRTGAALESGPVWVGHGGTEPVLGSPSDGEPAGGADAGERGGAGGRW